MRTKKECITINKFTWKGRGYNNSVCKLEIYGDIEKKRSQKIVVCSHLEENKGNSITNEVEILMNLVQQEYKLKNYIWIEHYEKDSITGLLEDTYDIVTSDCYLNTTWMPITKEEFENLISVAV